MDQIKASIGTSVRIKIIVDVPHRHELSFSVPKEPISNEDWVEIFEDLIKGFRAKDMPDPEVLGKYSPTNSEI